MMISFVIANIGIRDIRTINMFFFTTSTNVKEASDGTTRGGMYSHVLHLRTFAICSNWLIKVFFSTIENIAPSISLFHLKRRHSQRKLWAGKIFLNWKGFLYQVHN